MSDRPVHVVPGGNVSAMTAAELLGALTHLLYVTISEVDREEARAPVRKSANAILSELCRRLEVDVDDVEDEADRILAGAIETLGWTGTVQ